MAITGVPLGGVGTFLISLVPPNGVPLQSGPTVSSTDPLVTLGPVTNLQFTASVGSGDTASSFPIMVAGVNGAGTAINHTFTVPILPAVVQITDFGLSQVS